MKFRIELVAPEDGLYTAYAYEGDNVYPYQAALAVGFTKWGAIRGVKKKLQKKYGRPNILRTIEVEI